MCVCVCVCVYVYIHLSIHPYRYRERVYVAPRPPRYIPFGRVVVAFTTEYDAYVCIYIYIYVYIYTHTRVCGSDAPPHLFLSAGSWLRSPQNTTPMYVYIYIYVYIDIYMDIYIDR